MDGTASAGALPETPILEELPLAIADSFGRHLAEPWGLGSSAGSPRRHGAAGGGMSTVSVVIPCYGYGHLLPRCVESVLSQPDVDVDVLIIDDCSVDDSFEVARRLAAADPRSRPSATPRTAATSPPTTRAWPAPRATTPSCCRQTTC